MALRASMGTSAAVFAAAWMLSASAYAQECAANADCPKGFACEVTGGSGGCAGLAPACEPGQECPTPEPVDCVTEEYKSCVPAPCTADTDCAEGMVCYEHKTEACTSSDAPCSRDGVCPEPTEPTCTTETEKRCLPRYVVPCTASADCGAGFDCVAFEECTCSGGAAGGFDSGGSSGAEPGAGGGAEPTPVPAELDAGAGVAVDAGTGTGDGCTCTPSEVKYCKPQEITCTAATDCPDTWTCEQLKSGGGTASCTRPDGDAGVEADCTVIEPEPTVTESFCMPPFADLGFGVGRDGEVQASSGGGTAGGENTKDGALAPTAEGDSTEETATEDDGGLCSVTRARGQDGSAAGLALSLLGLFVVLGRARRRAARSER